MILEALTPEAAAALSEHGFEQGVAYMPIPRCDTCKWWERFEYADKELSESGECSRPTGHDEEPGRDMWVEGDKPGMWVKGNHRGMWVEGGCKFFTECDFGCVQWESKDGGT